MTVTYAFMKFASDLNITELQQETVSTRQRRVRTCVGQRLDVIDDFLTGSYRRDTMIAPLKDADVDVFLVLNAKLFDDPPNGPANVLAKLKHAIDDSYSEATDSSRNGQAVTINFSDFKVDVVPSFNAQGGGYLIPDPNERKWIHTNPKTHVSLWSQTNSQQDGKFVPFVKMIKAWNRAHSRRFRSFHLETVVREVFRNRKIDIYPDAANYFFQNVHNYINVPDPAGLGGNFGGYLSGNLTRLLEINVSVQSAGLKARDAIALNAAGKTQEAISKWQIIFGDYFPSFG